MNFCYIGVYEESNIWESYRKIGGKGHIMESKILTKIVKNNEMIRYVCKG